MLTVQYLEIMAEAATPLNVETFCGSALRGAFFQALWSRFCTNHEARACQVCPLVTACPVATLVAPLREEASWGHDVPRPYIILPPCDCKRFYEPGEAFTFVLKLVGSSITLFPYVLHALLEMEKGGIGRPLSTLQGRRGRLVMRQIYAYHPFTGERQMLWEKGSLLPTIPSLSVTTDDIEARAEQLPSDKITIHFLSPTRLITNNRLLLRPDFRVLMLRLTERLERLQHKYGTKETRWAEKEAITIGREWYLQVGARATDIQLIHDETSWMDVKSHSARQKRMLPIGGFVGRASFTGDLASLRALLVWGEVLHVGKNAVKGGGHYHIEL